MAQWGSEVGPTEYGARRFEKSRGWGRLRSWERSFVGRGFLTAALAPIGRPVASDPGSRLGATARLPERGVVESGRQCVSTAGRGGPLGCQNGDCGPVGQRLQAAASANPAELRGRTVLESGFERLSAAWPGLGGWTDAVSIISCRAHDCLPRSPLLPRARATKHSDLVDCCGIAGYAFGTKRFRVVDYSRRCGR